MTLFLQRGKRIRVYVRGNTDEWTGNDDWKTKANHKGFDVPATRSLKEIHNYMSQNNLNRDNTIIWLAGHSRGGAVSGILTTYLINEGFTVYSYNYATPNQVEYHGEVQSTLYTTKRPDSYKGIFNLVNSDDLVPYLPMEEGWGFTKYGTSIKGTLNEHDKNAWMISGINKGYKTSSLHGDTLKAFANMCNSRNDCYKYEINEDKRIRFKDNSKLYDIYTAFPEFDEFIDEFNSIQESLNTEYIYMKPVLFMQILAGVAAKEKKMKSEFFAKDGALFYFDAMGPVNIFDTYLPIYYNSSAYNLCKFTLDTDGMNPHFVDAYIILVQSVGI